MRPALERLPIDRSSITNWRECLSQPHTWASVGYWREGAHCDAEMEAGVWASVHVGSAVIQLEQKVFGLLLR